MYYLLDPVKVMASIIQLIVQDRRHLLGDVGVLQVVPLEDGA